MKEPDMTKEQPSNERRYPESLRLKLITPALTVDDLQASLSFYRDVLGFTVKESWEDEGELRGVALVAGGAQLMLGQDDWKKGRDRPKGVALRFWFTVSRPVDELAGEIRARGGTLASEPEDMPWGGRAFSIVDPDGFQITFASDD
jgi:catechol 2,3-dioxygenase-like lactoylglutathione lyase family enzyme